MKVPDLIPPKREPHPHPLAMNVSNVARVLDLSRAKVYELLGAGLLRKVRLGGKSIITVAEIEALLVCPQGVIDAVLKVYHKHRSDQR